MYKILIIEDDITIANVIGRHLETWEWQVDTIVDFHNVMAVFSQYQPDLVLMDISLPFYDGYHWCREIRRLSNVPIIFLSSAADNMNIVMAMTMGADDFITKPFDLSVLTAKIQAMLRRAYSFSGTGQAHLTEHRGTILNSSDATLTYRELKLDLTKNEFRILQLLFEHRGHTVSRETVMQKLWETDSYVDDNTLTVNVTRLRKKLEAMGLKDFIMTKKGLGYLIP